MDTTQGFTPLSNKITAKMLPKEEKTAGGIITLDNEDQLRKGIVLATGRGFPIIGEDGNYNIVPLELKPGQTILFHPQSAQEIEVNGEKIMLMTEDVVMGVLS